MRARSIARPEAPRMSLATIPSLMFADSSSLRPVSLGGAVLDEALTVAREIAKFANRLRWNKAGAKKAVFQQLREPLTIPHVRLPTRHRLVMLGIHQDHRDVALEDVEHWFPEHPAALHRDVRHVLAGQPVR
jgi:hypothetical protein